MKTKFFYSALFLMSILFWACEPTESVIPSDNVTSKTYSITTFDRLDVSDPFEVYINFTNGNPSMRIEANDNLHSVTEVTQRNGKLTVKINDNTQIQGRQTTLKIYLQAQDFRSITGSGVTRFYLQDIWEGSELDIELTGASTITGGVICRDLDVQLTGASEAHLFGEAEALDIEVTGASKLDNYEFVVDRLTADLEGASEIALTVNQLLNVKASGASTVYYKGQGSIQNQNLSGGSTIIKAE